MLFRCAKAWPCSSGTHVPKQISGVHIESGRADLGICRILLAPSRAPPSVPLSLEFGFSQACRNQQP
jgi:hypothetical protein